MTPSGLAYQRAGRAGMSRLPGGGGAELCLPLAVDLVNSSPVVALNDQVAAVGVDGRARHRAHAAGWQHLRMLVDVVGAGLDPVVADPPGHAGGRAGLDGAGVDAGGVAEEPGVLLGEGSAEVDAFDPVVGVFA